MFDDFDAAFGEEEPEQDGEAFVSFADDIVSDAQTETDVRNLEGRHKMSFQQMKEQILGAVSFFLPEMSWTCTPDWSFKLKAILILF